MDAVFQKLLAKVDQQPNTLVSQSKVREKLLLVNWGQYLNGFQLHNHHFVDDHVREKANIQLDFFPHHGDWLFLHNIKTKLTQLVRKDAPID